MRHGCLSHENEDWTVPALCRGQTCFLFDQQGFLLYFPFQINAYSWEIHGKPLSLKVRLFHVHLLTGSPRPLVGMPNHILPSRGLTTDWYNPLQVGTSQSTEKGFGSAVLRHFQFTSKSFCISGQGSKIVAGWALLLEIFLFVLCFGTVLLKVTDSQAQFLCPPLRGGICSHPHPTPNAKSGR